MGARGSRLAAVSAVCALAGALCAVACCMLLWTTSAGAAVKHEYLSQITEIPAGAPAAGPLHQPRSMTLDSGHLWLTQEVSGSGRVDEFDASTGAFIKQLPPGAAGLEGIKGIEESGVAVGHSTGEEVVYVGGEESTSHEGAVAVFGESGSLLGTLTGAETPSKTFGSEGGIIAVAVDNSTSIADWAAGDLYVDNWLNDVVDVFKPEAGGKGTYVTQLTGVSPSEPFTEPFAVAVDESNGDVLVLDSKGPEGVVDVFAPGPLAGQYEFARTITAPSGHPFTLGDGAALAVDGGNGEIYVVVPEEGNTSGPHHVYEFNSAGVYLGQVSGASTPGGSFGHGTGPVGVAVDSETHHVFVGVTSDSGLEPEVVDVFGADLVLPDVVTEPASNPGSTGATLNGSVNPDEAGEATCEFVWGTTTAFGETAACSKAVPDGGLPVAVQVPLGKLQPDTTYYYRLEASNAKNGTNAGESSQDRHFTTLGPGLHGESVSNIASGSATFDATINPHDAPTSYYFQYGPTVGYGSDAPAPPGAAIGAGEGDSEVAQHVQGLRPGTTYHYRVVVLSEVNGSVETFLGPDQVITTQAAGGSAGLPDGREWELVSPPDKYGAQIPGISEVSVIQAAANGDAMTYVAYQAIEPDPMGYADGVQILSMRGTDGWSTRDIATPHSSPTGVSVGTGNEYRVFSEDLSLGVVEPEGSFTPMVGEVSPAATERTVLLRHDATCATTPETCYMPLVTGAAGHSDVPPGTVFGGDPEELRGEIHFVGATPDLSHVFLSSSVALTSPATEAEGLYEWSGGQLQPVVPGGELGYQGMITRHAISDDGSRIFLTSMQDGLHLVDTADGESVRLDVAQPGAPSKENEPSSVFQAASSDGSRAFFTDGQRLTEHSGASGADLYLCNVGEAAGKVTCGLRDLTPEVGGQSAGVRGVLDASEDGSYIYFVATGALSSVENGLREKAVAGADNLYLLHYGGEPGAEGWEAPRFIGVLSAEDSPDWSEALNKQTARVSPDGRYLAFMSDRSLTGYQNMDAFSGKPDEEVYLYDASTQGLVCASCNPTGARPVGIEYGNAGRLVGGDRVWPPSAWLAANIPGWTPFRVDGALYQSRYLSDSGRLFFNSNDALVPQDVNGTEDVYEYEPAGVPKGSGHECATQSATYSERSDGCVGLISSGTSSEESAFLDASETGTDVFFLTEARLVPEDFDKSPDVYDAQECTVAVPCRPKPAVAPPACTTADSCRAAPSPQPATFGAPASATFSGAGNLAAPAPPKVAVVSRSLTRAQKLARALRTCRKKLKQARAGCERRARRRYGKQAGASVKGRSGVANRGSNIKKSSSSSRTGR